MFPWKRELSNWKHAKRNVTSWIKWSFASPYLCVNGKYAEEKGTEGVVTKND
jgi:hypothetical protein